MRRACIISAVVVLSACQPSSSVEDERTVRLESAGGEQAVFQVEVADTATERARGLMYRESLPPDTGMLFVFAKAAPRAFWMKNTVIPLDILYFSATGGVVSLATMTPCETDPCPTYPSHGPAKYALELPAGTVEEYGLGFSWSLMIE